MRSSKHHDQNIMFRVSEQQKEMLTELAYDADRSVASYLRGLIDRESKKFIKRMEQEND